MRKLVLAVVVGVVLCYGIASAEPTAYASVGSNGTSVVVRATNPANAGHFACTYIWTVTFTQGKPAQEQGRCQSDVPDGIQNFTVCLKPYTRRIQTVSLQPPRCVPK